MTNRLITAAFLVAALFAPISAGARVRPVKAPTIETGVIKSTADADTFRLERADGSVVKVRLHYADAPEIAHSKGETDQPGGKEALDWFKKNWEGKTVTVTVRGKSYDRIVGDVVAKDSQKSLGLDLVSHGYAQCDPRFHPPQAFKDAENKAKESRLGVFKDTQTPVTPWDWRAKQRIAHRETGSSAPSQP